MDLPLVEKYRPKSRSDLVGNEIAINELTIFLKNWYQKRIKNAALLLGPAGSGKTSSVYALASELNFEVIEVNASDTRAKKNIKETLGIISEFAGLEEDQDPDSKRIILMDEVDGLSGQKDRGGLNEFIKIIKSTLYPIICTANDPENDKIKSLIRKTKLRVFNFERLDEYEVFDLLSDIASKESIDISEEDLEKISDVSAGDLRAAINELESYASGTQAAQLVNRDKMVQVVDVLNNIYGANSLSQARNATNNAPSDYYGLLLQLFDETYKQCNTSFEVWKCYEQLALADLVLSRIMRTQDWALLKHFFIHISSGLYLSRSPKYKLKLKKLNKFPSSFKYRGIAKQKNSKAMLLAPVVAPKLHISKRQFIYKEFSIFSKILLGKRGAEIAAGFNFDDAAIDALQKLDNKSTLIDDIDSARERVGKKILEQSVVDELEIIQPIEIVSSSSVQLAGDSEDEQDKKDQTSLDDFF